jgi:probable HAF family extracellular repeat protein
MTNIARTILIAAFLGVLAIPTHAVAQAPPRFILLDLGTLGGPNSYLDLPGQTMNATGSVIFDADTSAPDPFSPNCISPDCLVPQGGEWHHGILTKLDSLPGGSANGPFSINAAGLIAGFSQIAVIDPLTGFPEARAVVWQDGKVHNLGTLPGGSESNAFAVSDSGLVAGPASNAIPDPYSCSFFICWGTETRAVIWQNGVIHDLGTLGGPDALPLFMNNTGQIAGQSYTSFTPNTVTGQPNMDPFLWKNGTMRDLGSLGGGFGVPNGMNGQGEVVGQSDLAGDQASHPFLWNGARLVDLGTLGGDSGTAYAVNDAGQVVGAADLPGGQTHDGFLWQSGRMTDLKPTGGAACSNAFAINAGGQAIGNATDCQGQALAAVLWVHGSASDLNTLIAPSSLHLTEAEYIDDRGEIVAFATLPNGNQHVVLLVPSGLAASEGLRSNAPLPLAAGSSTTIVSSPARHELHPVRQDWRLRGYHLPAR